MAVGRSKGMRIATHRALISHLYPPAGAPQNAAPWGAADPYGQDFQGYSILWVQFFVPTEKLQKDPSPNFAKLLA